MRPWRRTASFNGRPKLRPLSAIFWILLAGIATISAIWITTTQLLEMTESAKIGNEQATIRINAIRTGLAAGAGTGAAVGLMLAFRRQRHQEIATALNDHDASERRITDLYTKAADQLGSDKAPVRLAGLYALERLAQDNPGHRQTIVNVICAYLRMPYMPPPNSIPSITNNRRENQRYHVRHYKAARQGQIMPIANYKDAITGIYEEREVRLTAQRILSSHLQPPIKAVTAQKDLFRFWDNIDLDLTGATLLDFDLAECTVTHATFTHAKFFGTTYFYDATFNGIVNFNHASFMDHVIISATFNYPTYFFQTHFSSDTSIANAHFKASISFTEASFEKPVVFTHSVFNGYAYFNQTIFGSDVEFFQTNFTDKSWFDGARFTGTVNFKDAKFNSIPKLDRITIQNPSKIPHIAVRLDS